MTMTREAKAKRIHAAATDVLGWCDSWMPDGAKDSGAREAMTELRTALAVDVWADDEAPAPSQGTGEAATVCVCGHHHSAGSDGEDGGCRDGDCACTGWQGTGEACPDCIPTINDHNCKTCGGTGRRDEKK